MEKMTEEELNEIEYRLDNEYNELLTKRFINLLKCTVNELRTLQQQNKQMKEALKDISSYEVDFGECRQIARLTLQSIQGGSHDTADTNE